MIRKTFLTLIIVLLFCSCAYAQNSEIFYDNDGWDIVRSDHFTIYVHPDVKIGKVNRRIGFTFSIFSFNKKDVSNSVSPETKMAMRFDQLLRKVEEILDMYPQKMHINVRIYQNQHQLNDISTKIFGPGKSKGEISFYIHKYTTIFTSVNAMSRHVMAHEMGHAVLDHYFLILPPESVKELLAQYVEIHLKD